VVRPVTEGAARLAARVHRARLSHVAFVGVTGSIGKTTTTELIAAVLRSRLTGHQGGVGNEPYHVVRNVLRTRRQHQFSVVETAAPAPGVIERSLAALRPRIGVVTRVATDHLSAYGSIEAIAAEKAKLIAHLPSDGIAVLNADDPLVIAMTSRAPGRIITFGLSADADVRAEDVRAAWPDRLSFTVVHGQRSVPVETQLVGAHWVSAALAAMAVGVAMNVPLEAAAEALGHVPPVKGRMYPMTHGGMTFIRDDRKASVGSVGPALDFVRDARAARKVVIVGTLSDFTGSDKIYSTVAKNALEVADLVAFVGPRAFSALRAKRSGSDRALLAFGTVRAAADHFRTALRPGDLVLLKASISDHLARVMLVHTHPVGCWRTQCGKGVLCDDCSLLTISSAGADSRHEPDAGQPVAPPAVPAEELPGHVIVGLGNPEDRFRDTPHNVGQAVVDRLAAELGASWISAAEAQIASGDWKGEPIWLVKPAAWVNHSGPALEALGRRVGFGPDRCILVYDDLNLPLGTVRVRMSGSDGGHRGVRSILETFQTDQFRRVKVGVKASTPLPAGTSAVLRPFTGDEAAAMEQAYPEAIAKLAELVTAGRKVSSST
jgi:aminoacyl-tRNA hydrolase